MFKRLGKLFTIKGYTLFVICVGLIGIAISITGPYMSIYCTEALGMTTAALGVLTAVNSLSGVVVNSWIAKRSDQSGFDRKYIVMIATIASALSFSSYIVFHNYFALLAAVAIFGGCGAPAMPQIFAYAREATLASNAEESTFATSTLRSLFSLGFLIGPLFGTIILAAVGFQGLFLSTASMFIGIALVILFFLKRKPVIEGAGRAKVQPTDIPAEILSRREVARPFIAFTLLYLANFTYNLNTPLYLVHVLHGPTRDVGLVISLCAGLEIPLMIGLGALARRVSNHSLMMYGCGIAMVLYVILLFSSHVWELVAVQFLQASFIAIIMGIGMSYFQDMLPHSLGRATTLYANASSLGLLVGNLSWGVEAQLVGFRNVYWVSLTLVAISFVILRASRTRTRQLPVAEGSASL